MPIFYKDVIQGTSQWADLRAGIPTASEFHRIVTPSLKPSKSAEMYLCELIAERLTGEPTVGYTSHWMDRGSELEKEAVNFYEFTRDIETEKIGFVTSDDGRWGASPDRLCGDSGLLEIKVGKPATHVGYLLQSGAAYEEYKIQAQSQIWVAEREWNDLMAYNPLLPPAIYRANRDEAFIKPLSAAVQAFVEILEQQWELCVARGWTTQPKVEREKTPSQLMRDALIEVQK